MSNCANIINRLFSEVCFLKEREAKVALMLDILQINQAIFQRLDTTVYIIREDPSTINVCGIPVKISVNGGAPYNALVVLSKLRSDCIVSNANVLEGYGARTATGFFEFTSVVPLTVFNANPEILNEVDQSEVIAALKACAATTTKSTVTCAAYDALLSYLAKYGIRTLTANQAACIYEKLQSLLSSRGVSAVAEERSLGDYGVDVSAEIGAEVAAEIEAEAVGAEPNQPFEPAQPYEPSDLISNVYVRQLQDSTISDSVSNNESIELKLKALLEATETSEQTD